MIYLIRVDYYDRDNNKPYSLLKIGYCDDNRKEQRLGSYRTENPCMTPLYFIDGGTRIHETRLHNKFKHLRYTGHEWFKEDNEIYEFFDKATIEELQRLPLTSKEVRELEKVDTSVDIDSCPEKIKDIMIGYNSLTTYVERIRYICKCLLEFPEMSELIISNLSDHDKIKQQLIVVGVPRIRSLGYNLTKINREIGITIFDRSTLDSVIYEEFTIGKRYTKKYIKERLGEIYKTADFNDTPKANQLEMWFNIKTCKVLLPDGTRPDGFEIISKKQ